MFKKICAILCVVIGIAVIILGASFKGETASFRVSSSRASYTADSYNISYASFGGDFYTYIYRGSDTIVDELNDINHAIETVVKAEAGIQDAVATNVEAVNGLIRTVNKAAGLIVMAIGLGILAFGLNGLGKAFDVKPAEGPAARIGEPAPVEEPAPDEKPAEEAP